MGVGSLREKKRFNIPGEKFIPVIPHLHRAINNLFGSVNVAPLSSPIPVSKFRRSHRTHRHCCRRQPAIAL